MNYLLKVGGATFAEKSCPVDIGLAVNGYGMNDELNHWQLLI